MHPAWQQGQQPTIHKLRVPKTSVYVDEKGSRKRIQKNNGRIEVLDADPVDEATDGFISEELLDGEVSLLPARGIIDAFVTSVVR